MDFKWRPLCDEAGTARKLLDGNLAGNLREHSLARRVFDRMKGVDCQIFARSLLDFDETKVVHYRYAQFGPGEFAASLFPGTPDPFVTFVEDYLISVEMGVVVLQNCCARSSDPLVERAKSRVECVGDDVYHPLFAADVGTDNPENALCEANNAYWFTAFCVSKVAPMLNGPWTAETIELLADNTTHVITEAFDGEGYLVATPRSRLY